MRGLLLFSWFMIPRNEIPRVKISVGELDDISNLNRKSLGRIENNCKIQSQLDLLQVHYELSSKYAPFNQALQLFIF